MKPSHRQATETVAWWSAVTIIVAMAAYGALASSGIALVMAGLLAAVAILLSYLRFAEDRAKFLMCAVLVLVVLLVAHFVVGPGFI